MHLTKLLNFLLILWTSTSSLPNNSGTVTNSFENRVLGGFTCSTEEFVFMVLLMKKDRRGRWQRKCGASLINAQWVLTAGHCLDGMKAKDYLVVAAVNDPTGDHQSEKSAHLFVHPKYDADTLRNDIGLIKLEYPLKKSEHIGYISLPPQSYDRDYMETICNSALVMGWGYTSNSKDLPDLLDLQCAFLPVLTMKECTKMYSGYELYDSNICTLSKEGKDACIGDSGGPLLCGAVQTGVVSWGVECGLPTNPGIFTRVDQYKDFIDETIAAASGSSQLSHTEFIVFLFVLFNCVILVLSK